MVKQSKKGRDTVEGEEHYQNNRRDDVQLADLSTAVSKKWKAPKYQSYKNSKIVGEKLSWIYVQSFFHPVGHMIDQGPNDLALKYGQNTYCLICEAKTVPPWNRRQNANIHSNHPALFSQPYSLQERDEESKPCSKIMDF